MPRRRNLPSQPTQPPSLGKNQPAQPTHLPRPDKTQPAAADLRERLLADFAVLRVPLRAEQLDAALSRAEHEGLSHVQFLHLLIGEQADQRRRAQHCPTHPRGPFPRSVHLGRLRLAIQRRHD